MITRLAQHAPLAAALVAVGCVKNLPPAPTPQPVAPAVDATAPVAPGSGRLVIDVVDGPTPIRRVTMASEPIERADGRVSYQFFETSEILCERTPCVADVPAGNVLLGFPVIGEPGALEVELVHALPTPSVYRRTLSARGGHRGIWLGGILSTTFGGMSALVGATLLPVGLGKDSDGLVTAGVITLAAGAVLTAIGIPAIRLAAPSSRPGSSIHFEAR